MRLYLLLFTFLITTFSLNSLNLTIREKVVVDKNIIKLSDIIKEPLKSPLKEIVIKEVGSRPELISADKILETLFAHNVTGVNLIGSQTVIYQSSYLAKRERERRRSRKYPALGLLEEHLANILNEKQLEMELKVLSITPSLDLKRVVNGYRWELGKLEEGLKDLTELKRVELMYQGESYAVNLEVKIRADVWFSKEALSRNSLLDPDLFYTRNVEITDFSNPGSLVFDLKEAANSKLKKNMSSGRILRWSDLEKIPTIVKGEQLKLVINKSSVQVIIPCVSLEEGFLNEKLKVRQRNGSDMYGILKYKDGEYYVEAL